MSTDVQADALAERQEIHAADVSNELFNFR